jgi:predicted extracellular nuclease
VLEQGRGQAAIVLLAAALLGCSGTVVPAPADGVAANDGDTPVFAIQGRGAASPLVNRRVTTRGVVTRVNHNGYFLQDPVGDGDALSSDGVFVHTGRAPRVAAGQWVRVSAQVVEHHAMTQLTAVSAQHVLGAGPEVAPVAVRLPTEADALERVEGMLVRIDGPLTVAQNRLLGRYGQLTLVAGGRPWMPTDRHRPGSDDVAAPQAVGRIVLDDGSSVQNPTPVPYLAGAASLRIGDTLRSLVGVVDQGLTGDSAAGPSGYRVHPTRPPAVRHDNPRAARPPGVGGRVRVAAFNVHNYFTSVRDAAAGCFPNGLRSDCRGAANLAELARQRAKIVAALVAIDADAIGLVEIENNGLAAVRDLVEALNEAQGAGTYASVPLPESGTGGDAIKVAIVYKPARLARVGMPRSDAHPTHHRAPLAQTFAAGAERFTLVVAHFKSKSCEGAVADNADRRDGQGCFNARRVAQGAALRRFVAEVQAATRDPDVLLVGDLNAYAKEDPVVAFTEAGWVDQVARFDPLGYSYVFDGAAGRLDHALATPSLSPQVSGAAVWHINADEPALLDYKSDAGGPPTPYRSSDHDPVVVGLSLGARGR